MIGFLSAASFSVLAQCRARALGESVVPRSWRDLLLAAILSVFAAASALRFGSPAAGVGAALLVVTAWTDLRLRRVYLPVTAAGAIEVAGLGAARQLPADAILGALGLGAVSLVLWFLASRRGGWAGGDVLLFALVGALFGFRVGVAIVGVAFVGGALTFGLLIACRIVSRDATIPMGTLVYCALPVYLVLRSLPIGTFL